MGYFYQIYACYRATIIQKIFLLPKGTNETGIILERQAVQIASVMKKD